MPRVAVAASGGADSLLLLLQASREYPLHDIVAVSVDHGSREAAATEQALVRDLAVRLGIRMALLSVLPKGNPHQASWREARMDALLRFCRAEGVGTLWLGHHYDDSIETAVIRLFAGGPTTALAGISAAGEAGGISIRRPLLNLSAREIRRRLIRAGQPWAEDPSNRKLGYTRTAVRRVLRSPALAEAGALLVAEAGRWRARRETVLGEATAFCADWYGPHAAVIDPARFRALPPSMAEAVLRALALAVAGHAQRLRRAEFGQSRHYPPPWQLGGVRVEPIAGQWWLFRDWRHVRDDCPVKPGETVVWDRRYSVTLDLGAPDAPWRIAKAGRAGARQIACSLPTEVSAGFPALWRGDDMVRVLAADWPHDPNDSGAVWRWRFVTVGKQETGMSAPFLLAP